jgi:hypothetical protein
MLKKLLTLSLIVIGALTLSACTPETGPTVAEILADIQEAQDELALPTETSTNLTLPTSGVHEVVVTWSSSDTDVIANDGTVTIPTKTEGNKTVTMTASLTLEGQTLEQDFIVTVLAATEFTDAELVQQAKDSLVLAVAGIVTSDIELPATGANGTTVTWASSNTDVVADDGTVTRPENGDGNAAVTLTATITLNSASTTKEIEVLVQENDPANLFATVVLLNGSTLGDVVEFEGIVSGVFGAGYFLTDGTDVIGVYSPDSSIAPAIGDTVYVKGEYAKYNTLFQISNVQEEDVTATGGTNPIVAVEKTITEMLALDSSDPLIHGKLYTVTGTIELRGDYDNVYIVDGDDAILVYYGSLDASIAALEAQVGKEVTVTVIYYTNHASNGVMVAFDGAAEDVVVNVLSDPDALAADLSVVGADIPRVTTASVALPAVGPNGTVYTNWTSSDATVLANDGAFVARGTEAVTVTFTATATKGAETGVATIEVTVPVVNTIAEVNMMSNGTAFEITGYVYTISYYGFYIWDDADLIFVYAQDLVAEVTEGDMIHILGFLGSYSGLNQVNVVDYTVTAGTHAGPTAIATTVEAALNDVHPRGSLLTVTGTVSIEGSYDNVYITGAAGGKIGIYYRSNADEVAYVDDSDVQQGFVGQVVTLTIVTYQDGNALFQGVAADITVVDPWTPTDAEKAQAAADVLDLGDIDMVTEDLVLPLTQTETGATIAWATSDAAVVTDAGVVTIPFGADATATLTATVTVGAEVVTRDFVITVKDGDLGDPVNVAAALLLTDDTTVLVTGIVSGFNYKGEAFLQDADGTAIFLDTDIEDEVAMGDLVVVRGVLGTYTSNNNNQRELNSVSVVEVVSSGNAVFVITDVTPATLGVLATIADYSSKRFTMDLTIYSMDLFGYTTFTGDGTTLIKYYTSGHDYFRDLYEVGDVITMTFNVYNINYDDLTLEGVVLPDLTDADKMVISEAQLDISLTLTEDVVLPLINDFGATITWATSDAAVVTDAGVITRPVLGDPDVTATLTATIVVGTETAVTKDFLVTVKAEQPVLTADLFFSEYAEADGGSCKYVEIYNPTAGTIDLSTYSIIKGGNGTAFDASSDVFDLTGTLAAGAVLVLGNSACTDPGDASQTAGNPAFPLTGIDWVVTTVVGYVNGDDALGLFNGATLIDTIGLNGVDPGSSWDVGNGDLLGGTTANVIMVRIPSVTMGSDDWAVVAMQWIVSTDNRDYSTVGTHTVD